MLNHYIILKFKPEMSDEEKRYASYKIKKEVEGLHDKFPGVSLIKVENLLLQSSTADVMIFVKLDDEETLKKYVDSPIYMHIKEYILSIVAQTCYVDFFS